MNLQSSSAIVTGVPRHPQTRVICARGGDHQRALDLQAAFQKRGAVIIKAVEPQGSRFTVKSSDPLLFMQVIEEGDSQLPDRSPPSFFRL